MKKINYEEIGEYIGKKASEYFGRLYSDKIEDYFDDLKITTEGTEYLEDGEIVEINLNHIELYEVGKVPLIIEWHEKFYYKNQKCFDYVDYYKKEYYVY